MNEFSVYPVRKKELDRLYEAVNHRRYVHPDPLEFLYNYPSVKDREIVALIAAALAYGRVAQILKSVSAVLQPMKPSPYDFLANTPLSSLRKIYAGFVHRFAKGDQVAAMLFGVGRVIEKFGSLNGCFLSGMNTDTETVFDGLCFFAGQLTRMGGGSPGHLIPSPEKGSACKRLNLFLRWMVRKDAVDTGGWEKVPCARLIVPLDTHMHRVGLRFGFTSRRQANRITAQEVTDGFRRLLPEDPVRYDFALTRVGIRKDIPPPEWMRGG